MTVIPADIRTEIDKLERKHGENPDGRYFVPLANAYRRSGSVSRAISVLSQGIQRHPDYLSAHIVLGRCYADQGDLDAARGEFDRVLSADQHNLVALRMLGELAATAGEAKVARRWYERLLLVDPMNEEARAGLEALGAGPAPATSTAGAPDTGAALPIHEMPNGATGTGAEETSGAQAPDAGSPAVHSHTGGMAAENAPRTSARSVESVTGAGEPGDESPVDGIGDYEGGEIVITETIAELYTRQGFFPRAVHVYRELLRRHGEDPRIRERLNRVERLAWGDQAQETDSGDVSEASPSVAEQVAPPAATPGPAGDDANDPFAESFTAGFPRVEVDEEIVAVSGMVSVTGEVAPEAGSTGKVSPAPEAPAEPVGPANAPGAPRIQDYLLGVLDWHAEGGPPGEPVAPDGTASPIPGGTLRTGGREPAQETPIAPPADAPDATPVDLSNDELFPWEVPPGEDEVVVPPLRIDRPPTPGSRFTFDDLGTMPSAESTASTSKEPETVPRPASASAGPARPADKPAADDDDDDLESFQAWLRSLKR